MTFDSVDRLFYAVVHREISADDALSEIVSLLHSTAEPNVDLIDEIGCGPLESLFHQGHEEPLWSCVEQLAREDKRFRRALGAVLAVRSPRFDQRERLLDELGEYTTVTLRFVVRARTLDDADGFDWRSYKVDALPEHADLPPILRGIAAHVDQQRDERPRGYPDA